MKELLKQVKETGHLAREIRRQGILIKMLNFPLTKEEEEFLQENENSRKS